MGNLLKLLGTLTVAASLIGCAGSKHPLGMSTEEWESLSFEKKVEANQRHVALEAAGRYQRDERRRRLANSKIARSSNPDGERLIYMQTDYFANYDNRADCVIQGEVFNQSGNWEKAYPVHFVATKNFPQRIVIQNWQNTFRRPAKVSFSSIGVTICPLNASNGMFDRTCMRAPQSDQWLNGGEIIPGQAHNLFRGTAQCHVFQEVWKPMGSNN